jgi:predicted metal-dependent peptidase
MNACPPTVDFDHLISASLLRLRMKSPFFGTLAMLTRFVPCMTIPCAATDGRDIFLNPEFLKSLPIGQQEGILVHEILHAALLHPIRARERDPHLWNVAADIVVNGTIVHSGFELPPGGLRDEQLEQLSVEEVYELLRGNESADAATASIQQWQLADLDLLAPSCDLNPHSSHGTELNPAPKLDLQQREVLSAHWRQALQQAAAVARTTQWGKLPIGIEREFESIFSPQIDWRVYLWRYLVQTPTDFQGFDRRFVGRGLYLEALQSTSVRVYVAIDTSGSVSATLLALFMSEIQGILGAYPHLECDLYYVDCEAHGPYSISIYSPIPPPEGGGGTSFISFFDRVRESWDERAQAICIYLTDGYGEFPTPEPALPTLWVVTPGGLDLARFPFGEAVRLIDDRSRSIPHSDSYAN